MTGVSPLIIAWTVLAGVGGLYGHELCHLAAARLLGRQATLNWRQVQVVVVLPEEPDAADQAIGAAPYLVAIPLWIAWIAAGLPWLLPATVGLGIFSAVDILTGDHSDLDLMRGDPQTVD